MTAQFPKLPDGSEIPFGPADVASLDEWDYQYFVGAAVKGGGGHRYGIGLDHKTEFPEWVQSLAELQTVQDLVLGSSTLRVQPGGWGKYLFRAMVSIRRCSMVVQVVLDGRGNPITIFPVNGDGVGVNFKGLRRDRPFDLDGLLNWDGGDD